MAEVDRFTIDTSKPSIARVYDAFVGGKDNYEVDREVLRYIQEVAPEAILVGRQCRAWLIRVVRFLAGQAGIDQFLDLGSGLPTAENTHEEAQRLNAEARVVYVDNDPTVAAHGRALLEENEHTRFLMADLRNPAEILASDVVTRHFDLSRPVGLIQSNSLHHVADDEDPVGIMQTYVDALAPGSYVAISHLHNPDDGSSRAKLAVESQARFNEMMGSCYYRTRGEIAELFRGLEMVEPGLTHLFEWWPNGPRLTEPSDGEYNLLGGVARKP
ncbi:SAM-dependent methyltransferase [Amycolatopsis sp. YIM 10]|uniref:SAM-dependent methyltransferase n=1 Tax=Amycolatopsis sp. YIM 10 TaxID=2653857 RepID=UPI0012902086|nr:SAM-dependent methyltransferase [Amycolatopsis sp. YIM 10]QFU86795.1 S-adenosyl methyltransferase [Amycolatopsis sp. YIM 10]